MSAVFTSFEIFGPSIGCFHKEETIWNSVLEKMERHLAEWKRFFLSKGGKVTLISTISNLPTYFLSLFPVPVKVANRMEKLQRDFFWSGIDAPKISLVE